MESSSEQGRVHWLLGEQGDDHAVHGGNPVAITEDTPKPVVDDLKVHELNEVVDLSTVIDKANGDVVESPEPSSQEYYGEDSYLAVSGSHGDPSSVV
eukprot:m.288130 g.288130  ORF g.288130 m.288130 type:complete len:97 (-) comp17790_c0_seq25:8-298(-)